MSFPVCPVCGAELGPNEGSSCLHHTPFVWRPSIADLAVCALEVEPRPITIYDAQRSIERTTGRQIHPPSINSVMGTDRRFCWAGKGTYGLFRHGLLPGPRNIGDVAVLLILSYRQPLLFDELTFVMKWSGYRFQDPSLANWARWGTLSQNYGRSPRGEYGYLVSVAESKAPPSPDAGADEAPSWPYGDLVARSRDRVGEGIAERQRRLER